MNTDDTLFVNVAPARNRRGTGATARNASNAKKVIFRGRATEASLQESMTMPIILKPTTAHREYIYRQAIPITFREVLEECSSSPLPEDMEVTPEQFLALCTCAAHRSLRSEVEDMLRDPTGSCSETVCLFQNKTAEI